LRRKRRKAALVVRIVAPAQKRASLRWLIVHETEHLILGVCGAASLVAGDRPSVRERRGTRSLALLEVVAQARDPELGRHEPHPAGREPEVMV
jgi:hypothetical protein